jgi:hypothetical protein
MKTIFSYRNTRYTAIVMLVVWLMTLGVGIANACLVSEAHGHLVSAEHVQAAHHSEADEHTPEPDKALCLTVCAAEQIAAIKVKQLDNQAEFLWAPIAWAAALTIAVVDLNDRSEPLVIANWREPPVSIRFLRLTI